MMAIAVMQITETLRQISTMNEIKILNMYGKIVHYAPSSDNKANEKASVGMRINQPMDGISVNDNVPCTRT
jgi:hypothetical protein